MEAMKNYQNELTGIVRSNISPKALKEQLLNYHENDIAAAMETLAPEDRGKIYRVLDAQTLSDTFEYLEDSSIYFHELGIKKKVDVLSCMNADEAVALLRRLGKEERNQLIDLVDYESRQDINLIASFDEDEIGSRMTTNYILIQSSLTVPQAMKELVRQAAENDNISTIYAIDEDKTFYGAIDLKDLIIAREGSALDDIITTSYPYVYARELVEKCVERLKDYSEDSIPVLDDRNHLLGVITSQDLVEVIEDEMGEDYARLAGLTAEEELNEPVRESIRKRLPWLVILLALGLFVSSVVGIFEGVVAQLTIVMCFQSLILDMSGNVGTQSLAVTIRVLMDENLDRKQKLGFIFKEARIGMSNGFMLGMVSFVAIGAYLFLFKSYPVFFSFAVSGCIGLSLLVAMLISSMSGTVIPMFFKKIHVDPAVASGPLITTVNDLVAVVSYYGLVWLFLIQLLGVA